VTTSTPNHQATTLPWRVDKIQKPKDRIEIWGARHGSFGMCEMVAEVIDIEAQSVRDGRANAEYIVRACNNFHELLAALKGLSARHEGWEQGMGACVCSWHVAARAAIDKAEGR
jgi:hypothetical protein